MIYLSLDLFITKIKYFSGLPKGDSGRRTDGQTDGRTDGRTADLRELGTSEIRNEIIKNVQTSTNNWRYTATKAILRYFLYNFYTISCFRYFPLQIKKEINQTISWS